MGKQRRSPALDGLRGLAVLLMVSDHLAFVAGWSSWRETVGRAAMPLFFVLGGHLVRRVSLRSCLLVPLVGLAVEAVAPWSGAAGLLLCFAAGALLVAAFRERARPALWLLVAGGLTLGANGYAHLHGVYYDPRLLVALMALGALTPRGHLERAGRRVQLLAPLGRYPLTAYAGHVVVLSLVAA